MGLHLLIVYVLVGVSACFCLAQTPPAQKSPKTTQDFIDFLCAEAVKDAQTESHIHLDYTVESIKRVEGVLGSLHDLYVRNHSSVAVNALAMAYGAYIGEVIRKTEPNVRWEKSDAVGGEKSYPLIWAGGHAYPMAWCYRRIVNGDEDNVWNKYQAIKEHASQKDWKP
jgi:hypothetical protein